MKFFKRGKKKNNEEEEVEQLPAADANNAKSYPDHASPLSPQSNQTAPTEKYDIEESNVNKSFKTERTSDVYEDEGAVADYTLYDQDGEPIYIVKQKRGYLSILFSLAQTVILIGMMMQCKVAPMKINPMIGPYPDALSYWGGKNSYDILYDHEYWRLFTPILLHAGVFHLVCNIAVQLDTGAFFEKEWGSIIWLIIYLGSAASGSVLSVIVSPNSIGVGSSGAVCGLFGAKIAEALCRCYESTKTDMKALSHAILCEQFASTLCTVILVLVFSFIPYVDWAAHVGGLIGGFLVGLLIFSLGIKTRKWKCMMFSFGFVLTLLFTVTSIFHIQTEVRNEVAVEMSDVCGYYAAFFEDYQCNCMLERHQDQN